jgi:hypothetical protein
VQGANVTVQRFLALHKRFYPIKSQHVITPSELEFIGVVDAQRRDRFGKCAEVRAAKHTLLENGADGRELAVSRSG